MVSAGDIEAGVHRVAFRIYYEDTDLAGIVYHANYVKFFERGRSDFLRIAGIDQRGLSEGEEGIFFAVRHMDIDFLKPAVFEDEIVIESTVTHLGGARVTMEQRMLRADTLLSRATVTVAVLTKRGRGGRLPQAVRTRLECLCLKAG